jgi:hypothetical protein
MGVFAEEEERAMHFEGKRARATKEATIAHTSYATK